MGLPCRFSGALRSIFRAIPHAILQAVFFKVFPQSCVLAFTVSSVREHTHSNMRSFFESIAILAFAHPPSIRQQAVNSVDLLTDLSTISQYWGQLTPYSDNAEDFFGVENVGVPAGCQVEQTHVLQRHANRFPGGADDDGGNAERFAAKISDFTSTSSSLFIGPLTFLNTY